MPVIGLTGGIASGKSTAAAWMKELGAIVIDADRLGHRVYEPGSPGFQAVVNEFGHDLVQADGTINRQLLGGRVFGDPEQMKRLTDIVWPEIRRLATLEVAELKRREKNTPIVLEAAVLVEANWFDLVDEVWVVVVDPAIARARLMARNGLTEAQAQARIDSQISNKERSVMAFVKIDNSGTLEGFREAVDREWKKLARRAGFTATGSTTAAPTTAASRKTAAGKATAVASKASASKAAPATKAPAAKATTAKAAAATKPAPAKAAPAKATASKPSVARSAPKAAPARTTTRSASTQSASTRTSSARPAARAAAAPAKAVATKVAATKTAARKAVATTVVPAKKAVASKPVATRAVAAKAAPAPAAKRAVATKVAAKPAARPSSKPAAPVAGRRAGAK